MRFAADVILVCIRWYVAYTLSYRHLEDITALARRPDPRRCRHIKQKINRMTGREFKAVLEAAGYNYLFANKEHGRVVTLREMLASVVDKFSHVSPALLRLVAPAAVASRSRKQFGADLAPRCRPEARRTEKLMQHIGDLSVEDEREIVGQVTGITYVCAGGTLVSHGQHCGGLIIEQGGVVILHGQSSRNVVNQGTLELYGQVSGRVIGNPPVNEVGPNQIMGIDLPVPFTGSSSSWSFKA